MKVNYFYDAVTATFTYVIIDSSTGHCAIIDPVLDYEPFTGVTESRSADIVLNFIQSQNLKVQWILETHLHADHLTASYYLKERLGGKIGIGEKIIEVLEHWVPVLNTSHDTPTDGSQFDKLFKDGEEFKVGSLSAKVLHTPGHTPACVTYVIEDAAFVGDTVFMPSLGTARADFPGGDPRVLYQSIRKILSLPEDTRLYMCHDYPLEGHDPCPVTTVKEEENTNYMINKDIDEEEYVSVRTRRDKGLAAPRLLLPSIQINMRAGYLGEPEDNGIRYIRIPLNII